MAQKRVGKHSVVFSKPPVVLGTGSAVGAKEGNGPLGKRFDVVFPDDHVGQSCWEKAEIQLLKEACDLCIRKGGIQPEQVDYLIAGDLLNQLVCANMTARDLGVPFLGVFGACSTMAQAIALGSMLIDGGFGSYVIAAASSHHSSAERQFRAPTEFGVQKVPTAQWTVTGAGSVLLGSGGDGPMVTYATIGHVVDLGVKDANDMGTAMAPAAAETLWHHFQDTGRNPEYYDLILTGDLGHVGKSIAVEMLKRAGFDVSTRYNDCGLMIYDAKQDSNAGGSGAGCSASVLSSAIVPDMISKRLNKVLYVGTGCLFSPTSSKQGETLPGIAHAVALENPEIVRR